MSLSDNIKELQENGVTIVKNGMDLTFLANLKAQFLELWKRLYSQISKGNFTSVDLKYDWILDKSNYATVKEMTVPDIKGSTVLHLGPGKETVRINNSFS